MKIFINLDSTNQKSVQTKEKIIKLAESLKIETTDNVDECDILFSIGGDGTFLKTARLSSQKPIIGINTGTLGYLTEINPQDVEKALKDIINDNYYLEDRMMLEGEIIKANGDVVEIPESLNEIAISKNSSTHNHQ